jgi:hypothetical protein
VVDVKAAVLWGLPPGALGGGSPCAIDEPHCEQCGSTDGEDTRCGEQGYSACCNELVVFGSADCRGFHAEDGS